MRFRAIAKKFILFHRFGKQIETELIKDLFPKDELLFDAGCGDGTFSVTLSDNVVGVDLDPMEIGRLNGYSVIGDLSMIPIRNDVFMRYISNSVMEHVPLVREALKDSTRIMKKGGIMVITVPNGKGTYNCILRALFNIIHILDTQEWCDMLEDSGMEIKGVTYYLSTLVRKIYVLTCIFPPLIVASRLFISLLSRVKGGDAGICIVSEKV